MLRSITKFPLMLNEHLCLNEIQYNVVYIACRNRPQKLIIICGQKFFFVFQNERILLMVFAYVIQSSMISFTLSFDSIKFNNLLAFIQVSFLSHVFVQFTCQFTTFLLLPKTFFLKKANYLTHKKSQVKVSVKTTQIRLAHVRMKEETEPVFFEFKVT